MTNDQERIFIIGGTGNIGTSLVKTLLPSDVPLTLFARSPDKVQQLFSSDKLTVVKGDYSEIETFKKSIVGHTRLFLLINDSSFSKLDRISVVIADAAYEAGVKQIVCISGLRVSAPWRISRMGETGRKAEEGVLAIPNRGRFVALRPGQFMSNQAMFDLHGIKSLNTILGTPDPDEPRGWISTNDIGVLAARILLDSIEKHGDAVYEMTGDVVTNKERAAIISHTLGREITYQQITDEQSYQFITQAGFPHATAYDLLQQPDINPKVTPGLSVLLGRAPETLGQWFETNKAAFQ
ncbi:hypothetical protein BJV82DRAFT_510769 [Fennellomyces sp. T-0311]|nr:hypothetical protein BJV82DRAFT_510769 [Fennellomyces sp. T-0311]